MDKKADNKSDKIEKRPVGRPRKTEEEKHVEMWRKKQLGLNKDEKEKTPPIKRKRGRPRKFTNNWYCCFCTRFFVSKHILAKHSSTCKKIGTDDYKEIKKQLTKSENKNKKLEEQNKKLKEKVLILTSKLDVIFTTMSKPSILKTGDYEPIILSQQRFDRIVEQKYIYEIFCKGIDGGLLIYAMFLSTGKDGIIQAGIYDDAECELKAYDKLISLFTLLENIQALI
jgi:hypothetical protein